ncbi:MAG: S1 RNA-binding domain-containing protein [Sedimentisphaerales bacterium]|nr:S1 RNA-binding domain-containing protein [Sedimentisphaerales bacterium]
MSQTPENNQNSIDNTSDASVNPVTPVTPDHVKVIASNEHPAFNTASKKTEFGKPIAPEDIDSASVEREIADALGDMSLLDMDSILAAPAKARASAPVSADDKPIPGILRGQVFRIAKDGLFITGLGGKSEGFLPMAEVGDCPDIKEGDAIDVCIVGRDPKDGMIMLSRNAAAQQIMLKNLKSGDHVEVTVTGSNKGGLEVKIKGGVKAFMPISQIDLHRVEDEDKDKYVNRKFICEVTQAGHGDKNIVVSRRRILQAEQEANAGQLWTELEVGQIRRGVVRSVMDYGAFVDLGGVEGLVHVSELSWAHIDKPSEMVVAGQEVEVFVKEVNQEKKRLSLSLKLVNGNPWATVEEKYPVGSRVQAKVVRLMNFGAFAELEPGIDGLIPVSEMSWLGRVHHPQDVLKIGDLVETEILKCSKDSKQISMSIKALQGNPWNNIEQKYVVGQDYEGQVVRLSDFGAFVQLEPGVDGLIHVSELSDKHVKRPADAVKEGETVKARVLEVDQNRKRIALSLKALIVPEISQEEINLVNAPEQPAPASETAKPKRKKDLKGGLSCMGNDNPFGLKL